MPVHADSGDYIDQVSAVQAWAEAAREILVATAARPRGAIEAGTLARQVQQRSGVHTRQPSATWVGPLLGMVARQCQERSEPLLPALVVRRDGTVGPVWDEVLRFARLAPPSGDREEHAATQRIACQHRWAGAAPRLSTPPAASTRPATGQSRAGAAAPSPAKAPAARPTARKPPAEPLQGKVCPRCFMQMSLTGVCDNCD